MSEWDSESRMQDGDKTRVTAGKNTAHTIKCRKQAVIMGGAATLWGPDPDLLEQPVLGSNRTNAKVLYKPVARWRVCSVFSPPAVPLWKRKARRISKYHLSI